MGFSVSSYHHPADQYPSPEDGEGISPQSDMAGPDMHQLTSPYMPNVQLQSSHGRTNQGSISSLASSDTAVSNADSLVEVKEEMSPLSMNSPNVDMSSLSMGMGSPSVEMAALDANMIAAAATVPSPDATAAASTTVPPVKAKRKRENRYKNAPPAVLSRRRAQNRASQRAYRERKDKRIRDLEQQLANLSAEYEACKRQMSSMHTHMIALRMQCASTGNPLPPYNPMYGAPQMARPSMAGPSMAGPHMAGPPVARHSLAGPSMSGPPPMAGPPMPGPHTVGPLMTSPHMAGPHMAGLPMTGPPMAIDSQGLVPMMPSGQQADPSMFHQGQAPPNFNMPPQDQTPSPHGPNDFPPPPPM